MEPIVILYLPLYSRQLLVIRVYHKVTMFLTNKNIKRKNLDDNKGQMKLMIQFLKVMHYEKHLILYLPLYSGQLLFINVYHKIEMFLTNKYIKRKYLDGNTVEPLYSGHAL